MGGKKKGKAGLLLSIGEPRENIFTSRRKEGAKGRQRRAGWHEMTDPSSLSVYTPSIFVGANRAAV